MKLFAVVLIASAISAAAALPSSVRAADDGLRVGLVLPVQFGTFPGCPTGAALYQVVSRHSSGSGTTCLLSDPDFTPCAEGLGLCRDLPTQTVLDLRQGEIEFDANQHEVITGFDPGTGTVTFQITWTGTVTAGTHKYGKLAGADVSGGGSTSFDANGTQTGDLSFVIGEADDS